eukprot:TRINITY_DN10506_c0_g1_i1.p2 TRINITY_DN10506_c0_g1~~TRINITY_DN10506_c0_g1_i1.p2  ORF type:complete len:190 (+),score=29.49 TRINITY_DN10506_c0_g1_i1:775-1344(+)
MGSINRGTAESDPAYYAGYITSMALDGATFQRVGYQMVINGQNSGMGIFNLSGTDPKASWLTMGNPEGCEFYYTVARVMGSDEIISLAPSASGTHSFNVVRWTPGGAGKVVANLPNAHTPAVLGIHLGYIASHQAGPAFGAMVIEDHGTKHKWAVLTMDLATNTATVNELDPEFLTSGGSGLSGFGVAL